MANTLEKRIQDAVKGLIADALTGEQTIAFGSTTSASKDYWAIRATRAAEDPPGTGIFLLDVLVIAHGTHSESDLDAIDTIFTDSYGLAATLATAGSGEYVMPQGLAVELGAGSKSGANLDTERSWSFGIWAQQQEIYDAA